MSKRTTPRPNQKPGSNRYKVFLAVRDAKQPPTAVEVKALLPGIKMGTISSALSEYPDRGCMTVLPGRPRRYMVTNEQNARMLANTATPAPDILALIEEPKSVAPQPKLAEPPTPAEVNLAIRDVLHYALQPLDADAIAYRACLPLAAVRTELSYMVTHEPHSAPYRSRLKGPYRDRATYHYMKSQKAWEDWANS